MLQVLVNVAIQNTSKKKHNKTKTKQKKEKKRKKTHVPVRICICYFKVKLWSFTGEQFYFPKDLFKQSQ